MSSSELSEEMKDKETNLKDILGRMARWEGVLLFDEAATFMAHQKRTLWTTTR